MTMTTKTEGEPLPAPGMRIDGVPVHADVTVEAVMEAIDWSLSSLDNPGFCIACGVEAEGVEPDARQYECESCGCFCVYGAEELMLHFG
jgi:hypothetical protein